MPIDYDPLLAKLVGYGQDRDQAVSRLVRALDELFVAGIKTNVALFRRILADEAFRSGNIDTGYLERLLKAETGSASSKKARTTKIAAIGAAVFAVLDSTKTADNRATLNDAVSSWKRAARTDGLM